MKRWCVLPVVLPLFAASQTRTESWLKLSVTHAVNKHWAAGIELQYRTQANYREDDKNIFHYPLGEVARLWLYNKLPQNLTLLFSPAGYFRNKEITAIKGDLRQSNEWRIAAGVQKTLNVKKNRNKNRLLLEERFINCNSPAHYTQTRLRLQNSFTFPVISFKKEKTISIFAYNEVMFKKDKHHTGFDQDRIFTAVQWAQHTIEIDAGYQLILQKTTSGSIQHKQLFVQCNFSI